MLVVLFWHMHASVDVMNLLATCERDKSHFLRTTSSNQGWVQRVAIVVSLIQM